MAHAIEESMKDPETGTYNPKWMNPEKLREWRGCLDDIAKELGERVKKTELTGKGGGPLTIETFWGGGLAGNEE
jgi:hypothetical protein